MTDEMKSVMLQPKKGMVLLERISAFGKPPYCIHGETLCVRCEKACWLGDKSAQLVLGGVVPVCMECAVVLHAQGAISDSPTSHVKDHLRKDGPH